MELNFTVPGIPKGKARPRVVHVAPGRSTAYTPPGTVYYENLIRIMFFQAVRHAGLDPDSPAPLFSERASIGVSITAVFTPPARVSKLRRAAMLSGTEHPHKKPDADNIGKIVLDALNRLAYKDDAQVTALHVVKKYGPNDSLEVRLEEL